MPAGITPVAGKTALVTGAAARLGRATALALARAGANVVIHYNTSEASAIELASEIKSLGREAWVAGADLGVEEQAGQLLYEARAQSGRLIDYLVNNASIFPEDRWPDVSRTRLFENLQINALAPVALMRSFAEQGASGAIVNFLDARIQDYDQQHLSYHISKKVLFMFTRILALELAPSIRVNAVAPGLVLPPAGKSVDYLERLASSNPLDTYGCPEGVAEAVLFLLRSEFITGQVIFVDGGRHLHGALYG